MSNDLSATGREDATPKEAADDALIEEALDKVSGGVLPTFPVKRPT